MTATEAKLQNGSHNLWELWKTLKAIEQDEIKKIGDASALPVAEVEGVEAYIRQLDAVDAGSFSFRYPLNKDGTISIANIERINLANFAEMMERLCDYLNGIEAYYGHLIETYDDMMSDFGDGYYLGLTT